jgi:hypothetical protein
MLFLTPPKLDTYAPSPFQDILDPKLEQIDDEISDEIQISNSVLKVLEGTP